MTTSSPRSTVKLSIFGLSLSGIGIEGRQAASMTIEQPKVFLVTDPNVSFEHTANGPCDGSFWCLDAAALQSDTMPQPSGLPASDTGTSSMTSCA